MRLSSKCTAAASSSSSTSPDGAGSSYHQDLNKNSKSNSNSATHGWVGWGSTGARGSGTGKIGRNMDDDTDGDAITSMEVPVSLVNLVVHADQRRAPLRMFHFADAPPSTPPPPPPPPAHNTPSPRRPPRSSVIARGGRNSGVEDPPPLPTTTEGVVAAPAPATVKKRGVTRKGEGDQGEQREGGERGSGSSRRLCATCELLPVVRIGDGSDTDGEAAAAGAADIGSSKREKALQEEGDVSANEQV